MGFQQEVFDQQRDTWSDVFYHMFKFESPSTREVIKEASY